MDIAGFVHGSGPFVSVYDQAFDAGVVGGGYAGLAAAMALRQRGLSVLLIEPRGDLAWESGRAMWGTAGTCDDAGWNDWMAEVRRRCGRAETAVSDDWLDPALAEVVAARRVVEAGVRLLSYAWPVAVERDREGGVSAVIVATKSGLRRARAGRWVDASEAGTLLRLMGGAAGAREASGHVVSGYVQHEDWSAVSGVRHPLLPTAWPTERCVRCEGSSGDVAAARAEAIERWLGDPGLCQGLLTHMSVQPMPIYDAGRAGGSGGSDRANVASASPTWSSDRLHTLADRWMLGVRAAGRLTQRTAAAAAGPDRSAAIDASTIRPIDSRVCDVLVAGGGTGGAMAALASARGGARTTCIDPMLFPGGIGSGGGIHTYYYGVTGGLQETVDARIKALMERGGRLLSGGPFNPEAKKTVLESMLREAGVDLRLGVMLVDVEKRGDRVRGALVATERGPIRIEASSFIDGTGDGDLCALAGAEFTHGRAGDGLPHAYSQSGGMLGLRQGKTLVMNVINYDAGWCDATDSEDLTRARLVGLLHYLRDVCDNFQRPTYLAPAIGLRQSRQVVTEHVLSLDDLVMGRRFEDVIGYSGCHYDNHAVDYELESDEAMFWIWLNRNWRNPVAAQMPYRIMLPRGLSNVWIASRALGVTQDAHHSLRMQRDMQRIGEAAGAAAAWCATHGGAAAREVDRAALEAALLASGALKPPREAPRSIFGQMLQPEVYEPGYFDRTLEEALADLDRGNPGRSMWWLYRHRESAEAAVKARLSSPNTMVSWLAAGVAAMWQDAAAEPRLIAAVQSMEYGYDGEGAKIGGTTRASEAPSPERNSRLVPNWVAAAGLLRLCGTERCLDALESLALKRLPAVNARTLVATTLERLVRSHRVGQNDRVARILDLLLEGTVHDQAVAPQRPQGAIMLSVGRGSDDWVIKAANFIPHAYWMTTHTKEDHLWQWHLCVAKARVAIGLPVHDAARPYLHDPRKLVRSAFERVLQSAPARVEMVIRERLPARSSEREA